MSAWDRQPRESARAFHHFTVYRDMRPEERSVPKAAIAVGISRTRAMELSDQWSWVSRAELWDAHVQAVADRAFLMESARRSRQRAAAAQGLLAVAVRALQAFDVQTAKLGEIAQAIKIAAELARLEEGLETARLRVEVHDARLVLERLPINIRLPLLDMIAAPDDDEDA